MSNTKSTQQAQDALLDAMIENYTGCERLSYSFDFFQGATRNPLQIFRLLSIDPATGDGVEEKDLARLTGLPEKAFTSEALTGISESELLTGLGRCALLWLDCVRGQILLELTEAQTKATPSTGVEGVLSTWAAVRGSAAQSAH